MSNGDDAMNGQVVLHPEAVVFLEFECCAMRLCGLSKAVLPRFEKLRKSMPPTPAEEGKPFSFYFDIFERTEALALVPTPFMRALYSAAAILEIEQPFEAGSEEFSCGHLAKDHAAVLTKILFQMSANRR